MKAKRNGSLDFWKFIFAIVIVISHGKNFANGENILFLGGSIGVEFFFIVSGVLMANSMNRNVNAGVEGESLGRETFGFMKKKISGLLPNIYLAWVIAFFVGHIGEFSIKVILKDGVGSIGELLFLIESGFRGYTANTVCWYISAMLIAMLILYPMMRKFKDTYFYILAPLIVIFLFGYTYQSWSSLRVPHAWMGYCYKSIIRAIMGLMIGSLCWKISESMRKINFTKTAQCFWMIIEWGGYGAVLLWSWNHGGGKRDWLLVLLMAVSILCTFSRVSITDYLFSRHKLFSWLGEYSFSLFLGHGYWSHKMKLLMPGANYYQRLPVYLLISFTTGLIIMYGSKLLKVFISKWKARYGEKIRKLFICDAEVY